MNPEHDGIDQNRVVRVWSDGSLDDSFSSGTGADGAEGTLRYSS